MIKVSQYLFTGDIQPILKLPDLQIAVYGIDKHFYILSSDRVIDKTIESSGEWTLLSEADMMKTGILKYPFIYGNSNLKP